MLFNLFAALDHQAVSSSKLKKNNYNEYCTLKINNVSNYLIML